MTISELDGVTTLSRRCWRALEPIHVVGYFAPETTQAYVDLGLHPRLSYFAARSAAFGSAGPGLTTATFYVFAPWLVAKALPAAWAVATPEQVQRARRDSVQVALHRVLGQPDVAEALDIARQACAGLSGAGRPLYAAHADLPWPEDDLLALWHAATLVREHRGDGHLALLQAAGLDPVESIVLGGLFTGTTGFMRASRGWTEEEWAAAEDRLRGRRLLTADGALSEKGRGTRQEIEDRTDALAVEGWAHVGAEACARLVELVDPLREQVLASGVLPGNTVKP